MEKTGRKVKEVHHDKTWRINMPQFGSLIFILALGGISLHWTCNNGSLENILILKEDDQTHIHHHLSDEIDTLIHDCNLFQGRWVYDDVSYPLYTEGKCSFLEDEYFSCEKYGRKDFKYQHWRWQPHHCDIPRFNGAALMEKLRGKKLVFVGDSLNRNQWRSMLCLIDSYLPPSSNKSLQENGNLYYFYSKEYNATIGFYWAPFLVESNNDDLHRHGGDSRIVRVKSIEKHGKQWLDAHILVFNSFVWWMTPLNILWGSLDDAIYKKVHKNKKLQSYEIALNTWSEWLELHIDPTKTKLFFISFSPFTLGNTLWGTSARCYNQSEPILDEKYWGNAAKREMMEVLETRIEKLQEKGINVEYLNITQLSGYREDAHLSIYRPFQKKQQSYDPIKYSDCLHWCLPGVPDTWNLILYAYIMNLDSF